MELGIDEKTLKKITPFFTPIGTIVVSIIITYFFGNFFWGKIQEVRQNIKTNTEERNVLETKLDVLRTNQVNILEFQDVVITALPVYNSSSLLLNQLINLQNKYQTPITNLEIRNTGTVDIKAPDVYKVDVQFTVSGQYTLLMSFLSDLTNISPISEFSELVIEATREGLNADVRLTAYYAFPPESIPAISDPIEDLNDSEKGIVSIIKEYIQPTIEASVVLDKPKGKKNPFILDEF